MVENQKLESLLARCAIKDQKAFKKLFDLTSGYLNRVAFNILGTEDASHDVVQEAYFQIWQNASSYRADKSQPMTWMSSITRYRAIDRLEKDSKLRFSLDVNDEKLNHQELTEFGPDATFESDQQQALFQDCLSNLNEKVETCIRLAYLKGYSREELSEMFHTKTNTIKSWLKRGVEALKQCIAIKTQQVEN